MKQEIKVPPLGESISEATISAILKPSGSFVKMDEEVIELATDKVNQVLYAPQTGIFTPTVKEEDAVKIGQVVGFIEAKAEEEAKAGPAASAVEKAAPAAPSKVEPSPKPAAPEAKVDGPEKARALNEAKLEGNSEGNARVSVDAFLKEMETQPQTATKKPIIQSSQESVQSGERETRRKMSKIRKIIASRLVEVQNSTAMLTTFNEVDLTEVIQLREKYKESFAKAHQARLGFMSFFIKAAVSALKAFPMVNAYIDGDDIVERNYFSIGIAVGGEKGLVVPVLKDCDKLSFGEIEGAIARYAQQVKEGKLSANDLTGGGFTITNGGIYGSLLSTPILNPKQCAILGMHKISKRPVVVDDQIVIRQMMYLALSYDHRIIDGKEAVSFLVHIKNCLEDPSRILLEL